MLVRYLTSVYQWYLYQHHLNTHFTQYRCFICILFILAWCLSVGDLVTILGRDATRWQLWNLSKRKWNLREGEFNCHTFLLQTVQGYCVFVCHHLNTDVLRRMYFLIASVTLQSYRVSHRCLNPDTERKSFPPLVQFSTCLSGLFVCHFAHAYMFSSYKLIPNINCVVEGRPQKSALCEWNICCTVSLVIKSLCHKEIKKLSSLLYISEKDG